MKKINKSIVAFLIATLFFLTGCSQFADGGGSIWQGGLWILPTLTAIGAGIFGYQAYKGSKSGSKIIDASGAITDKEGGNVPIYKFGQFWFSVGLTVATIIIILMVNSDK